MEKRMERRKKAQNSLKWYKRIGLSLVAIGLGLVVWSLSMTYAVQPYVQAKEVDRLKEEVTAEDISRNVETLAKKSDDAFNYEDVKSIDTSLETVTTEIDYDAVLGYVKIERLGFEMPIMYGTSHEQMLRAGGTMKKDMVMGEGNYAVAGHDARNPNYLFAPLHRAEVGDEVVLTDLTHEYVYKVTDIYVVEPTQVDVIRDVEGRKMVTLITCTDGGERRLVVQGDLVEVR